MKKLFFVIISISLISKFSFSQANTGALYNLTIGASNPAFTILGISPSNIERPRDPNNFAVLLQNASENFTIIPKNYAVEVSSWILKPNVDIKQFSKGYNLGQNLIQGTVLSIGTTTNAVDSINPTEITRLGAGIKFSLFRGDLNAPFVKWSSDKKKNQQRIDSIKNNLKDLTVLINGYQKIFDEDFQIQSLKKESVQITGNDPNRIAKIAAIEEKINKRKEELVKENEIKKINETVTTIESQISDVQFIRKGPKLDFAMAGAWDFKEQKNGILNKLGFWLTFEVEPFEDINNISILALAQLNYTRNINYTGNVGVLLSDFFKNSICNGFGGFRIIYTESNFTLSYEYDFGTFPNDNKIKDKYLLDFGYNVGGNKLIVLSLGKDFDGSQYKKGNLIAALNFLMGFGSERPF